MNTSCEKCEFATRLSEVQIGCEFNRIEKYKNQKVEIELIDNSYLIKNRICNFCRANDSDWGTDLSLEEKKQKATKEVELKLCAVIVIHPTTNLNDMIETAKSLESQFIPVDSHFVITSNVPKSADVITLLKKNFPSTSNLKWNVRLCFERNNGKPLDKARATDTVISELNQKDYQFYVAIDPGAIIPTDFSVKLNNYINEDLGQFIYLHEVSCSYDSTNYIIGPVVHLATHKAVGGNAYAEHDIKLKTGEVKSIKCDSVFEKITYLAIDQNCQHLIKDLSHICFQD